MSHGRANRFASGTGARTKRALANALLVFLSLLVTIAAAELATRLIYPDLLRRLQDVDHRMPPNQGDTNADGIRSKIDPGKIAAGDRNVIVLGDSFVYGLRLPAPQALPQRLQRMARRSYDDRIVNVLNFGWTSSSPYLSLRLLRDIGAKYRPDSVILVVDATDFHDDIVHRKAIEGWGFYGLMHRLPGTFYLICRLLEDLPPAIAEMSFGHPLDQFFAYNRPLAETRPYLEWIARSIEEIAVYSRDELGARFFLVLAVRSFQYSDRESPRNWEAGAYTVFGPHVLEPVRYFEERFAGGEFPYLSLLPAFQAGTVFPTTFETDPHWTPAGTQLVADAIFEFCREHGCFD